MGTFDFMFESDIILIDQGAIARDGDRRLSSPNQFSLILPQSIMTTAVDRRRIPGPTSSYPALPLSAYTSTTSSVPTQKRDRPSLEPRRICTSPPRS